MSFSDDELDNDIIQTPNGLDENQQTITSKIDYTKINEYINSLKYKEPMNVISINKMDRYKIVCIQIGLKQFSYTIYDYTNITYSSKISRMEEEISHYAIEVPSNTDIKYSVLNIW